MRRSSAIIGLILLIVGGLLLAQNAGLFEDLGFNVGDVLWPLALVLVGVSVIVGAIRPRPQYDTQDWEIPLEGESGGTVAFNFGAGELRLTSGAAQGTLLSGTFEGGLQHDVRRSGGRVDARVSSPVHVWWPWAMGPSYRRRWDVKLNGAVPLTLVMKTGASDCRLDLTDLDVKELRLESGAASMEATLPAHAGLTHVRGSSGAASVTLRIPEGVAARIAARGGLSSTNIDRGRFPRHGGVYQSPDYETALNKVDIHLDMGVGSITVR